MMMVIMVYKHLACLLAFKMGYYGKLGYKVRVFINMNKCKTVEQIFKIMANKFYQVRAND